MRDFLKSLAEPGPQLALCCFLIIASLAITAGVFLRFIPGVGQYAIGAGEPFWVLLLSILALLFAGLMGLPGALAYREVKKANE